MLITNMGWRRVSALAMGMALCVLLLSGCRTGKDTRFTELPGFEGMPTLSPTTPEPTLRPQVADAAPAASSTSGNSQYTGVISSGSTHPQPGPPAPLDANSQPVTQPSTATHPAPYTPTGVMPPEPPAAKNVKPSGKGAPPPAYADDTRIKAGEPIQVRFLDMPNPPPPFDDKVKEDGTITLMFDQTFKAAGLTKGELEQEIRRRYVPDYFQNLTVTVNLGERFRMYYVEGEVKQPGQRPYAGPITLTQAITACGGFTDFASKRGIRLIRASGGRTERHSWNKILSHPELDPQVYPNDKIHVKRSWF